MLKNLLAAAATLAIMGQPAFAAEVSLESAPPVVVRTEPVAGTTGVDPRTSEIIVQFSKKMQDGSWSWTTWGEENFPEMVGEPEYLADGRTCVLKVKLQPGRFYATWLNSDKFKNFKDAKGQPAVPYLLTFRTASTAAGASTAGGTSTPIPKVQELPGNYTVPEKLSPSPSAKAAVAPAKDSREAATAQTTSAEPRRIEASLPMLNDDQRAVLAWTDRQFRSYFDARNFDGWSEPEYAGLEARLIETLKGPQSRDYYQAINTLGAMRSRKALPALRAIAYDRADKNNRDRWMAIRALGLIGDQADVPELIQLVYHGNVNTRWWAQISLVRLTGQNFARDWKAWGKWWNDQHGEPPYQPEIIRWWNGQAEPDQLAESLAESDRKFLEGLLPRRSSATPAAPATSP